jgi:hypothetical protein
MGLTGISQIEVGGRGVIGESVAYDLNLGSDMMRNYACLDVLPSALQAVSREST